MHITDWQIEQQQETVEVSAEVDGFRLWYRVPKAYAVSRTADPFVTAALLPAMAKGEPLEVDPHLTVSPRLLANLERLQDIHHSWNPALRKVPVSARTAVPAPLNAGTFSFFSGGVDSMYTFLTRADELTHVVYIHGFDFFLDPAVYQRAVDRHSAFVHGFGKTLIPIQTNHNPFGYRYNLSVILYQGGVLAGVAQLLGFPRVYISSTYSYDQMAPLGSHPLMDPLWSSEAVEIIHYGAEMRRPDKLRAITACAPALADLIVCANEINANCGKCEKCLRTMIPLRLLGVQGPFPPFPPLRVIRRRRVLDHNDEIFLTENVALARQSQDRGLRRALLACLHRYRLRQILKELDRVFLGSFLLHTYRRRRVARFGPPRIKSAVEEF